MPRLALFGVTSGRLPETLRDRESPQSDSHACTFANPSTRRLPKPEPDWGIRGDHGHLAQALAGDLAAALDPCELAKRVNLAPDSWQAQLLRSTSKRQLVLCSRQSGKSTMAAVAACHTSLYEPGSLTLLVPPSERQSGEFFKRCRGIFRSLGWPVAARTESALRIELENGSRIVALPGSESTVRGYSAVRLLVLDEAARIPPELITATSRCWQSLEAA